MGQLRGGTTIGGFQALHSGLKEAYLGGNLTMSGNIRMNDKDIIINHHGKGIVFGEAGGLVGYIRRSAEGQIDFGSDDNFNFYETDGNTLAVSISGNDRTVNSIGGFLWNGQSLDSRYVRAGNDSYVSTDTSGNTSYPRMVVNNSAASDINWVRVPSTSGGLLPYSNGNSNIGSSSWRFSSMHANTFYEGGSSLGSKYADAGHNHDSRYLNKSGDTFSGNLVSTSRDSGIYGSYSSSLIDHIWSMGTAYRVHSGGADFGSLYGMAYKHTNNTTGGTMAGGHQIVFANGGNPGTAIGLNGNIWTNGVVTAEDGVEITSGDLKMDTTSTIYSGVQRAIEFFGPYSAGSGIAIGAGGLTIIGAGESSDTVKNGLLTAGESAAVEQMYVTSDNHINFYSGIQEGFDAMKLMQWTDSGSLRLVNAFDIEIGRAKYYGGVAGGDAMFCTNHYHIGASRDMTLWSETGEIAFRYGAQSSSQIALSVSSSGQVEVGKTITLGQTSMNGAGGMYYNGSDFRFCYGSTNSDWETVYTSKHISYGTGNPSGGSSGDIYIKY